MISTKDMDKILDTKPIVSARRKKVESTTSPRDVLENFLYEMQESSQWSGWTEFCWQDDNHFSVQSWGEWVVDQDDRNDPDFEDEDFEDWDWKVLSDYSSKKLKEIEDKIKKKYPEYADRLTVQGEEKEWLEIEIR